MTGEPLICFGYGSLVNTTTHDFSVLGTINVTGWRRVWAHRSASPKLNATSLSITPQSGSQIMGIILQVPHHLRDDLAQRERGYAFEPLEAHQNSDAQTHPGLGTYVSQKPLMGSKAYPILQSYLDVVLSGYWEIAGEAGVRDFLHSTSGWDTPILRDRNTPRYPRARPLSPDLQRKFDGLVEEMGAGFIEDS